MGFLVQGVLGGSAGWATDGSVPCLPLSQRLTSASTSFNRQSFQKEKTVKLVFVFAPFIFAASVLQIEAFERKGKRKCFLA